MNVSEYLLQKAMPDMEPGQAQIVAEAFDSVSVMKTPAEALTAISLVKFPGFDPNETARLGKQAHVSTSGTDRPYRAALYRMWLLKNGYLRWLKYIEDSVKKGLKRGKDHPVRCRGAPIGFIHDWYIKMMPVEVSQDV